jgi:hypothetical protein
VQRVTAWSGDVLSDFLTFLRQISAGLNYSISGMPYWTTDIGGSPPAATSAIQHVDALKVKIVLIAITWNAYPSATGASNDPDCILLQLVARGSSSFLITRDTVYRRCEQNQRQMTP